MHCGKKRPAFELRRLGDRIDEALFAQYVIDHDEEGADYATLLEDHAQLPQSVAKAIRDEMSATYGYAAKKDGEIDRWADACFKEGRLEREGYRRRWDEFRTSIREEGRFYNPIAEAILDDIFEDVPSAKTWRGESAVRLIEPSDGLGAFIRGRFARSDAELETILRDPAAQLGPPPAHLASAGRMNAAGVSVFYCAKDKTVCCQECRPPVGSHMVYGYFDLMRAVRVLDLSVLASMSVGEESIFSPGYQQKVERAGFLRRLDREISQPVMPGDEAFGYLHTQAVADYLAHRLSLDGVLYRSTQAGSNQTAPDPPQNLVLFHHASRVEPVDLSNWMVEVDLGWWDEDEEDGDDSIHVAATESPPREPPLRKRNPLAEWYEAEEPVPVDKRPITLRIQRDHVEVERVNAATYVCDRRFVTHNIRSLAAKAEEEAQMSQRMKLMGIKTPEEPF